MQWDDIPRSALFDILLAKGLQHPTSTAFSAQAWRDAIAALGAPQPRDFTLAAGAVEYGGELASLRVFLSMRAVEGLTLASGLRLLAAAANQQYFTLMELSAKIARAAGDGDHIESIVQAPVSSRWGQALSADDHLTSLVDTLPHWLFHIAKIPADTTAGRLADSHQTSMKALAFASIEHGLRNLWHDVLWSDYALTKKGAALAHGPLDRRLPEHWFAWYLRQQSLDSYELHMNMGAGIVAGHALAEFRPVNAKTVMRLSRSSGGKRTFIVGDASRTSVVQRSHVAQQEMLERLYTGLFLDETLPKFADQALTPRDLCKAWWVISDLGRLVGDTVGSGVLSDDRAVGRAAIPIDKADLCDVFVAALACSPQKASLMADLFTVDPTDTGRVFNKGVWFTPLLAVPHSQRRYLLLAPLQIGSALRRVEHWLELGGIADHEGDVKGRGKPFEAHARAILEEALANNPTLGDAAVHMTGLKRRGEAEEIDLLVRIGNVVLVGEVKCFTRRTEAMGQFNYLKKLDHATDQAVRKQAWAGANREAVALLFGLSDPVRVAGLKFKGVVVVNHSYGMGLERQGIPIVDLHYLSLLLGVNAYQGATKFEKGVGMTYAMEELYADEADFHMRLDANLASPPVMARYRDAITWRDVPFLRSDGGTLAIAIPTLATAPM